jgi:hypothetical protein
MDQTSNNNVATMIDSPGTLILPAWKDCLAYLKAEGYLRRGGFIPMEVLEGRLRELRDTPSFRFSMTALRVQAQKEGFYLSQRGLKDAGFRVEEAHKAADRAEKWARRTQRQTMRTVQYLGGVLRDPTAALTSENRNAAMSQLVKHASLCALMRSPAKLRRGIKVDTTKLLSLKASADVRLFTPQAETEGSRR